MKKIIFKIFIFILMLFLFLLTGCGSSNGSVSNPAALTPTDLEVQTVINNLNSSINEKNTSAIMSQFDSSIRYYKYSAIAPYTLIGYNELQTEFINFFNKVSTFTFDISSLAIQSTDTSATVRGYLSCNYTDASGTAKLINEEVEITLEKVGTWGIKEFYKYDSTIGLTGTQFPPAL